jgi:hypothetical protein
MRHRARAITCECCATRIVPVLLLDRRSCSRSIPSKMGGLRTLWQAGRTSAMDWSRSRCCELPPLQWFVFFFVTFVRRVGAPAIGDLSSLNKNSVCSRDYASIRRLHLGLQTYPPNRAGRGVDLANVRDIRVVDLSIGSKEFAHMVRDQLPVWGFGFRRRRGSLRRMRQQWRNGVG